MTNAIDDVPRARVFAAILLGIGGFVIIPKAFGNMATLSDALFIWREIVIIAFAISLVYFVTHFEHLPRSTLGLKRPTAGTFGLAFAGLVVILLLGVGIGLVMKAIGVTASADGGFVLQLVAHRRPWQLAVIAIVAGISEEIVFRGLLIDHIAAVCGKLWVGVLLSLTVFALLHLRAWSLIYLPGVVAAGLVLSLLYLWRRDLLLCVLVHVMTDLTGLFNAASQLHGHP